MNIDEQLVAVSGSEFHDVRQWPGEEILISDQVNRAPEQARTVTIEGVEYIEFYCVRNDVEIYANPPRVPSDATEEQIVALYSQTGFDLL